MVFPFLSQLYGSKIYNENLWKHPCNCYCFYSYPININMNLFWECSGNRVTRTKSKGEKYFTFKEFFYYKFQLLATKLFSPQLSLL